MTLEDTHMNYKRIMMLLSISGFVITHFSVDAMIRRGMRHARSVTTGVAAQVVPTIKPLNARASLMGINGSRLPDNRLNSTSLAQQYHTAQASDIPSSIVTHSALQSKVAKPVAPVSSVSIRVPKTIPTGILDADTLLNGLNCQTAAENPTIIDAEFVDNSSKSHRPKKPAQIRQKSHSRPGITRASAAKTINRIRNRASTSFAAENASKTAISTPEVQKSAVNPQNSHIATIATRVPLVVHPTQMPVAGVEIPKIRPLNQEIDVFSLPQPPSLMTELSNPGLQLIPSSEKFALVPTQNAQPVRYRMAVPPSSGIHGLFSAQPSTASGHSGNPRGGNGRFTGSNARKTSLRNKALIAGAAAGAAALLYANKKDKELVAKENAINQTKLLALFNDFALAVSILAEQGEMDGSLANEQSAQILEARATIKNIYEQAKKQGFKPYLIEASQLPADLQTNDPNSIQYLRLNRSHAALTVGDQLDQLVVANNTDAITAILFGAPIQVKVGISPDGQQIFRSFYLGFARDNTPQHMRNQNHVEMVISAQTHRLIRESSRVKSIPSGKDQRIEAQSDYLVPVADDSNVGSSGGGISNLMLDQLTRMEPITSAKSVVETGIPNQMCDPEIADSFPKLTPSRGLSNVVRPQRFENHSKQQVKAHPIKWAIREYGNHIIEALKYDLPLENGWARGSTELIDIVTAYNAMHEHWMRFKNNTKVERDFGKCKMKVHEFVARMQQQIKETPQAFNY